jgi:hypothetical protein
MLRLRRRPNSTAISTDAITITVMTDVCATSSTRVVFDIRSPSALTIWSALIPDSLAKR